MTNSKVVFTTHVNSLGQLKEAKEQFECPKCGGECFLVNESVSPRGTQTLEYECTDCYEEWTEVY